MAVTKLTLLERQLQAQRRLQLRQFKTNVFRKVKGLPPRQDQPRPRIANIGQQQSAQNQ